jgi:hypothetical protein
MAYLFITVFSQGESKDIYLNEIRILNNSSHVMKIIVILIDLRIISITIILHMLSIHQVKIELKIYPITQNQIF